MLLPVSKRTRRFTNTVDAQRLSVVVVHGNYGAYSPRDFVSFPEDGVNDTDNTEQGDTEAELDTDPDTDLDTDPEIRAMETSLLLQHHIDPPLDDDLGDVWEQALDLGALDSTTWQAERRLLTRLLVPLIFTFLLENLLSVALVFSAGHLGPEELAAVLLGATTATITGYTLIHGLATCLDTLCPQAYGAKRYHQVGMHVQRCTALIGALFFPIGLVWVFGAEPLLVLLMPAAASLAKLAAAYLRVVVWGIPGYIVFETSKRYLQAQGIFHASTYALFVCAPLNAAMNYVFVWSPHVGIGYLGAPLAVSINYTLMALFLVIYTVVQGRQMDPRNPRNPLRCWNGLHIRASFRKWNHMLHLAIPGVVMTAAEFFAFECLTLLALYLGRDALAAQLVCTTIAALTYQVPFALGIAALTRIANYIGSELPRAAHTCTQTALHLGLVVAAMNGALVFAFRHQIPRLFTSDEGVVAAIADVLPMLSVVTVVDTLNANLAGCLRGQGQQKIGGITNLVAYYLVGIPVLVVLTFHFDLGLPGLWAGSGIAMALIAAVQLYWAVTVDWAQLVQRASKLHEV